nr:Zn(II)2Cys6 transcription factor [Aspergillus niger CBS 513.88]|eukprot:XP_001392358.2 Zn(II)2Cys6 transcription factor [Aspergillus niger CBS 513.88]
MGRKPNQLILEFFIRGQKLEDASNRYQHTCKACGEKFPKGRIDSLTNHLVKKCQAIPLRDRQRVLLRLHELPDLADGDQNKDVTGQSKGKSVDLPFTTRQNFDGLNVLAEASRQVGASDQTKRGGPAYTQSVTVGGKTVVVDPALEAEGFQGHPTQPEQIEEDATNAPGTPQGSNASSVPSLPSSSQDQPQAASPPLPDVSLTPDPTSNARQSQLSMIAASASEMVPHGLPMDHDAGAGLTDGMPKMSPSWNQQLSTQEQLLFDSLQEHDPTLTAATQRAASFPRPIAMNPNSQAKGFVNEFGNSTKPTKPKKPCSGDSPCTTCASVESARLWKHPCIRTRIAEEFELYNANLHATLAYHDVSGIRNQIKFEHYAGRIEVTHFEESMVYVTFSGLQGHKASASTLDPQLQALGDDSQFQGPLHELYLLDSDADDLPGKIEMYIKKTAPFFYERETSDFMRPTLLLAAELSQQKKDVLLERVLELWIATHILADGELQWKTFCNPTLPPTSMHSLAQPSDDGRTPIDSVTNSESYELLCSQLRAATEKRASQLSKSVMNDLERRLLQRQQSGWFETFLVALILLNCVERTCWLFRSWDDENFAQRWPLDKRPPYYANQGDRFSDILHMLLKMRSLPPKATPRPDTGILKAVDGSDENAARWFDMIKVTPLFLEQRQATVFDPTDSRSLDLRYGAKLLPPTNVYT